MNPTQLVLTTRPGASVHLSRRVGADGVVVTGRSGSGSAVLGPRFHGHAEVQVRTGVSSESPQPSAPSDAVAQLVSLAGARVRAAAALPIDLEGDAEIERLFASREISKRTRPLPRK